MMISLLLAAAAPATSSIPAFLSGCWATHKSDNWAQECWMQPKAGLMIGASRQGEGETLKSWEWMNIQEADDGSITFRASPNGEPSASFKAEQVTATSVRFINAANDYPQRITYTLKAGELQAEISKLDGGNAIRWTYEREAALPKP